MKDVGLDQFNEVLHCTIGALLHAFVLILSKLVSPDDANLTVCFSRSYSVVFDEGRNIVFDWYFLGISASEAIERSTTYPMYPDRPILIPLMGYRLREVRYYVLRTLCMG